MTALLLLVHGALLWGVVGWLGIGGPYWGPCILAALVAFPGFYWARLLGRDRWYRAQFAGFVLLCGWVHLLLGAMLFAGLGLSLAVGAKVLAVWAGVPVLLWQRRGRPGPDLQAWTRWELVLVAAAAVVAGSLALFPASLQIGSDGPAHLGAVVDALHLGRWIAPDISFPGADGTPDPRFGLAHGLYAALAELAGASPRAIFAVLPLLLSPFLLLVHYELFRAIGAPRPIAFFSSVLFLVCDGDGRGYSLWSSVYPGHLALGIALLAAASILRPGEDSRGWRSDGVAPLGLALSARVHPFGWWITVAWLAMISVVEGRRPGSGRLRASTAGAAVLGAVFLLPVLLRREPAPWHAIPTDVLFLNGTWFVIDPLSFARWASTATFFALPAVVFFRGRPRRLLLSAVAVAVFLAFVPLVTTPLWRLFSYLLVRTGRVVPTALILIWGSVLAWRNARERRWWGAIGLALLCLGGLTQETRAVRWLLRGDSPSKVAPVERSLDEIAATHWVAEHGIPLASPRIAHGLRARVGGMAFAIPLAHTSPADAGIVKRLTLLRRVYSPRSPYAEFRSALRQCQARALLTVTDQPRLRDYEFDSNPGWERTLAARLDSLGVRRIASGPQWQLFDVRELPETGWELPPAELPVRLPPHEPQLDLGDGHPYHVLAVDLADSVLAAGGRAKLGVYYRPNPQTRTPREWTEIQVGFDRVGSAVPSALASIAKPVRKILLEGSGKSTTRWGKAWIPFDGGEDWTRDPTRVRREEVSIPVPPYVKTGEYRLWARVRERPWRVQHHIDDYLRDERTGAVQLPERVRVVRP